MNSKTSVDHVSEGRELLLCRIESALKSEYERQELIKGPILANNFAEYADAALSEIERNEPDLAPFRELHQVAPEVLSALKVLAVEYLKK